MSDATFDPFDLPSSFDPLGSEAPPPPRQRRRATAPGPPPCNDPPEIGAGGRLAHLFDQPGQTTGAGGQRRSTGKATVEPEDPAARLEALKDEMAILKARLDDRDAVVTASLDEQLARLVKAVTALLDERLGRRL